MIEFILLSLILYNIGIHIFFFHRLFTYSLFEYLIHVLVLFYSKGDNAVKVENINSEGVIIGCIKRKYPNDESCISDLLQLQDEGHFCNVSVVAREDSRKLCKASQKGFDVVIIVFCDSESELVMITGLLNAYDISFST